MKKIFLFLILLNNISQAQIINSIAGGGILATNIQATQAQLNQPSGLTIDANGNIYFTDPAFSIVRKIATSGILTTYAGNGTVGNSGMGGQATQATLNGPLGIVRDGIGNTYFADAPNNLIYKVSATGIINIFAGTGVASFSGDSGPATLATLNYPQGLAIDLSGNIYVADNKNNRIRKISTSGIISTVAGNGTFGYSGNGGLATAAALKEPFGVNVDKYGNIYIADTYNYRIRKVNTSGIISNFAGTGFPTSSGDGGNALSAALIPIAVFTDSVSGSLFLSDFAGNKIRKINTSNIISNVAGTGIAGFSGDGGLATNAKLNFPRQVVVKANGEVYFSDGQNQRIRKVSTSGIITTIAGKTPDLFQYANNARLQPFMLSLNRSNGAVYFSDYYSYTIRKIDQSSGLLFTAAGNGTRGFSGDGGLATAAQLDTINGVHSDTSGIYICDAGNGRIRKVNKNGIISTIVGTGTKGYSGDNGLATSAKIMEPWDLKIYNNQLYFIDRQNFRVRKVDLSSGIITTIFGTGVYSYSGDGGLAINASFKNFVAMDIDNNGNLYFADADADVIRKINTAGIVTTIAGTGVAGFSGDNGLATAAKLQEPTGVTVDDFANIYITDQNNYRIRKINSAGIIETICGNGVNINTGDGGSAILAEISVPWSIRVDANSNSIIFVDQGSNKVRMISNVAIPDICVVGSDSLTNYNQITWEKSNYFNVDSFIIYREVSSSPIQYFKVGALSNSAYSEFNDTNRVFFTSNALPNGDPKITTYKYKIKIRDNQNNFSFLSNYHNTVYINDLGNGSFQWNLYNIENTPNPISNYNLLRDTIGNGSWHIVGTTTGSQNLLVDPLYSTYQNRANWRVDGVGLSCNPTLKPSNVLVVKNKTKSNTKDNFTILTGLNNQLLSNSIQFFPNPSTDFVNIRSSVLMQKINIYNSLGELVLTRLINNQSQVKINLQELSTGIYSIEALSKQGRFVDKLSISK